MTAPAPIPDTIFDQAIAIPNAEERARFLDRACGSDSDLRRQAERLVQDHFLAGSFLERPAISLDATACIAPSERVGAHIGPYKLLEQIGEGGMGLVYMAEQQRPVKRLVALKLIKPGMDSKQVIARFEAERQALAMMDHPSIAKVLDAGASDAGRPFFVMELVRGIPINDFCDQKRFPVRERLALFIQVCQAVQHAHQKGIIHRDLKPTNVLVTMHDSVAVPKVIDFGIAKALGPSLTDHTLHTGFAQLVGTPLYMSPEQAEMNQFGVDTRSDVYSLGVMLYELLTGTTPFDKETLTKAGLDEMRRIIREQDPPRPSARLSTLQAQALSTVSDRRSADPRRISTSLRGELDWIVMKALDKERSERYESASSLAKDIERYLSGDLVHACPPSPAYRFRKFAKKNKTALTTASLLAASLLLGTTLSLWQALRATAAEVQATANATQASANEAKAKVEEQKALAAARSEGALRQQAEKSLEAALEAMEHMLANVNNPELSDVPRVGPLRRKMLEDAVLFFERAVRPGQVPEGARYRVATVYFSVAKLHRAVANREQAAATMKTAINLVTQLLLEEPTRREFRLLLADCHHEHGWLSGHGLGNAADGEKHFHTAAEIYGELGMQMQQAAGLRGRAELLHDLKRDDEALGCAKRVLELLELPLSASEEDRMKASKDRAKVLYWLAQLHARTSSNETDNLFRRCLAEARAYFEKYPPRGRETTGWYIVEVQAVAHRFESKYPAEALNLVDDCLAFTRNVCGKVPLHSGELGAFVRLLTYQARVLRRRAASRPDQAAPDLAQAEKLFHEAIGRQRQLMLRFGEQGRPDGVIPNGNPFYLIQLLAEEAEYLQSPLAHSRASGEEPATHKLQADALLTESIQLCRALVEEFPDDARYRNRLAQLLKLHAQHFGLIASLKADIVAAVKLEKHEAAELAARKVLAACEEQLGEDHSDTLDAIHQLAWALFRQGKFVESEHYFRRWVNWSEKVPPKSWETFNRKSILGQYLIRAAGELQTTDSVAALEKLAEAENILLTSHQGIKAQYDEIPAEWKKRLPESIERLVQLYEAWNKPVDAARWQAELKALREPQNRQRTTAAPPSDP